VVPDVPATLLAPVPTVLPVKEPLVAPPVQEKVVTEGMLRDLHGRMTDMMRDVMHSVSELGARVVAAERVQAPVVPATPVAGPQPVAVVQEPVCIPVNTREVPVKVPARMSREQHIALEALVAGSAKVDYNPVAMCKGLAPFPDGSKCADILATAAGILVNKHVWSDMKAEGRFVFGKPDASGVWKIGCARTDVLKEGVSGNRDLLLCKSFDGAPKLPKKKFQLPEIGAKVVCVSEKCMADGAIVSDGEEGEFGRQMRTTCSTEKGDCGSPYVNRNGCVVGIHFSEGDPKKNNLAVPVTPALLSLFDPVSKN